MDGRRRRFFPTSEVRARRLRVRSFEPEEITPYHRACLEAMIAAGIRPTADLNDMDEDVGAAPSPVNIWKGMRWGTHFAYLDPVRDREGM